MQSSASPGAIQRPRIPGKKVAGKEAKARCSSTAPGCSATLQANEILLELVKGGKGGEKLILTAFSSLCLLHNLLQKLSGDADQSSREKGNAGRLLCSAPLPGAALN